jgi:O-methyltransferase
MNKIQKIIRLLNFKDPLVRFEALRKVAKILMPEYRFKWPQLDWWNDPQFNKYLASFDELDGMNTDRRWMIYQLMRLVGNVPGDTAECGVYQGAGSYIICKVNQENNLFQRTHHVFDSFEGLSQPSNLDGDYWTKGDLSCSLETVTKNLSEFDRVRFYQGWIPERFSDIEHDKFCFVHIDVDLFQPTLDSFEFFYPRMNEGGILLCDDYGFSTCPGVKTALDQFLEDKQEKMVSLSEGGGFLVKGNKTSQPLQALKGRIGKS